MDLHHIRYFLAVCETLNFTRAAERCNVTQPALSRAVQQLEAEVGGLLFRREGKLTHITDLGRLLKPRLEHVLRNTEAAKSVARKFLTLENAAVGLGVMSTIGPRVFAGFLAEFQSAHPGIRVRVREATVDRLIERLEKGDLDLAILSGSRPFPERFNVAPLYRERMCIAAPAGHRFAERDSVAVRELKGENYLLRTNCEYRSEIEGMCREQDALPHVVYASEREDWIMTMVAAGLGICFLPEFSAVVPGVVTRPVAPPEIWREVAAASVAGRRFSPAVLKFLGALKSYTWPGGRGSPGLRAA